MSASASAPSASTEPRAPVARQTPGDRLPSAIASPDTLALLARRRSTSAKTMGEPGPSPDEVDALIAYGSRVPDHGKIAPWRFIVIRGAGRARIGAAIEAAVRRDEPGAEAGRVALERDRLMRAPVVIAVVSRVKEMHKIPAWEQTLSSGAVCQTMLIAAHAMGYGAQWLTEWYGYDPDVLSAMGLTPHERLAGFIYVGTATEEPTERDRPAIADVTTYIE